LTESPVHLKSEVRADRLETRRVLETRNSWL